MFLHYIGSFLDSLLSNVDADVEDDGGASCPERPERVDKLIEARPRSCRLLARNKYPTCSNFPMLTRSKFPEKTNYEQRKPNASGRDDFSLGMVGAYSGGKAAEIGSGEALGRLRKHRYRSVLGIHGQAGLWDV